MSFLVILLALLINHYWQRDKAILADDWFMPVQRRLRAWVQAMAPEQSEPGPLYTLLLLGFLPVALVVLLVLVQGVMLGLVTLVLHVGVLLLMFEQQSLRSLSAAYLDRWRAGNYQAAFLFLQERWPGLILDNADERQAVHEQFCRFLISTSLERLFAVVFWYLVLGPAAALTYHLSVLHRLHCAWERDTAAGRFIQRLVFILEWLPARLLALSFCLTGDFLAAFSRLRELWRDADRSAVEIVLACALAAVDTAQRTLVVKESDKGDAVDTMLVAADDAGDFAHTSVRAAQQAEDLLGLLQRSQFLWVSLLAILAVASVGT
jgi:AmpE protein